MTPFRSSSSVSAVPTDCLSNHSERRSREAASGRSGFDVSGDDRRMTGVFRVIRERSQAA